MMRCTYLSVPLDIELGTGIIIARDDDGRVAMSVFHSAEQGVDAVKQYELPLGEGYDSITEIRSGAYPSGSVPPRFEFPFPISEWLEQVLLDLPATAAYRGVAPPRICAFVTFDREDYRCGMACFYNAGPCEVVVSYTQDQADEVLELFPPAVMPTGIEPQPTIAELYKNIPERSPFPMERLTGSGAARVCAAIEAVGRMRSLIGGA